jgi:ferredoxin--NADP+ reductase
MQHDVEKLRKEHYNASVIDICRPQEDLLQLRVRPDAAIPQYDAGQWIMAGLGVWEERCSGCPAEAPDTAPELIRKPYSLSCAILTDAGDRLLTPEEHDWYELYVALDRSHATGRSGAALAARLCALEPGGRLWVDAAPRGNYTLATVGPDDPVVFLATGTGEAPHNRMIWELLRRGHRAPIVAAVTTRHLADLAYQGVHERLMQLFPQYRWIGVTTREPSDKGEWLQTMLEGGTLEERAALQLDPQRCHVFLCGNPGMLGRPREAEGVRTYPTPAGMIELLERRGYRIDPPVGVHVHFERY